MFAIFDKNTVPKNYHKKLKAYACQGLRVLAIGHKLLK
jgi:magnesium-transporting ATPase (P-type)